MKYDVIIIGAGPAGLTAALFASRAGLKVMCIEKLVIGGQASLIYKVENFPTYSAIGGFEIMDKIKSQAQGFGTEFKSEHVVKLLSGKNDFDVVTNKSNYKARKVIIACGCKTRKLGLDREQELTGKGVSYCASCDGGFFKDKVVAIVGGGDTAMQDAEYLSRLATKVYVLNRTEKFKAEKYKLNNVKKLKNVEFILNAQVTRLLGKEKLEGIEIKHGEQTKRKKVDGLFVAIGQYPELEFVDFAIDKDEMGYLKVDENQLTSVKNLYACGDITSGNFKQIITACAEGARAGNSCTKGA